MSLYTLVHIGSGAVSVGVLDGAKLVLTVTQPCRYQARLDQASFVTTVDAALKEALQALTTKWRQALPPAELFFSSPFVAGQLNLLRRTEANSFRVTDKVVAALVQSDLSRLQQDQRHELIDNQAVQLLVNGYVATKALGQAANSLEVAHYVSVADRAMLQRFRQTIYNACHHRELRCHAGVLAAAETLQRLQDQESGLVLVEVGGEITEISFIASGIVRSSHSFPMGSHSLWRHHANEKQLAPAIARSHVELGLVKPGVALDQWQNSLLAGLREVLQHGFWSGQLWLLAEDQTLASHFGELLQGEALSKATFGAKSIAGHFLDHNVLGHLVASDIPADQISPLLLVDSVFVLK